MPIHRSKASGNFTVFHNSTLQDSNLSVEAVGLLAYLLSMPENWVTRMCQLEKHFGFGPDKRKRIISELEKLGYMELIDKRSDKGQFDGRDYNVYDIPIDTKKPTIEPLREKPTPVKTDPIKDLLNNKEIKDICHLNANQEDWQTAYAEFQDMAKEAGLTIPRKLTDQRKTQLKRRIAEEGIDTWRTALAKVKASRFCCGENKEGWKVDFDFLINPGKLMKVLEGKYDNKPIKSHTYTAQSDQTEPEETLKTQINGAKKYAFCDHRDWGMRGWIDVQAQDFKDFCQLAGLDANEYIA